ncbi:probable inactive receptor kinase RLK902 [Impatiens glandulifera]|uniref:probable inactive receptor kinase RLK902 n=1 Tax=Impatiens glandulifera TaxID=253017 RepID=UPI001FB06918|nr:probable inactive receptor kinase RLK902 [Impatiens glandulifera]
MAITLSLFQIRIRLNPVIMLFFSILIFLSLLPTGMSDLVADRSALLSLRSAVGGRTLLWNTSLQTPCQWTGVQCQNDAVTALRLPGNSLSGDIPVGTVGKLTHLQTLSLRFNSLSGSLPSDLSSCSELRNLYLQGNHFSGDLPEFLFTLHRLVRINLGENQFSGKIPITFNNLNRIRTLYLEHNEFTGSIPDLSLPNLEQFNVSYNKLNGSIPKTLNSLPVTSFTGNSLCGGPFKPCSGNATTYPATAVSQVNITSGSINNNRKRNGLPAGAIAAIVIGSVLGFIFLILLLFIFCREKSDRISKSSSIDVAAIEHLDNEITGRKAIDEVTPADDRTTLVAAAAGKPAAADTTEETAAVGKKLIFFGNSARVFDLEDLLRASAEVLGKGTFGTAYKALLEMGNMVAVKRLKDVTLSEVEFRAKIEAVGEMEHQNLLPPRAYYYSREEKLLVYDYMPMGSLSALLHSNKGAGRTPLTWEIRLNIALGSARGIEHIHSQSPTVSHGNIKSSNVLLTKSNEPRLSDFGLNHIVRPSSTYPARFSGYRAPEVTESHRVSQQADVYSFGVLVLELLTGKAPTNGFQNDEGVDLPRWVRSIVKEEWTNEVFDSEVTKYETVEETMVELLQLAIDCTAQYPDTRPSIAEVRQKIEDLKRS